MSRPQGSLCNLTPSASAFADTASDRRPTRIRRTRPPDKYPALPVHARAAVPVRLVPRAAKKNVLVFLTRSQLPNDSAAIASSPPTSGARNLGPARHSRSPRALPRGASNGWVRVHPHRERRSAFSAAGHRWPHATPWAPAAAPSPAQVRAAPAATAWLPVAGHYLASRRLPRSPCSTGCVCAAPAAATARLPAVGHYSSSRRLPCSASRPAGRHRELRQAPTAPPPPAREGAKWSWTAGVREELLGATFPWLHLLCGSCRWLQMRLHPWSCFKNIRFGGLRLKPLAEPRKKPSQPGPER
ncbi:hypothetical protein PVAP13_5KG401035 [Panicum virgatum]|uniref:Uncharacterized protein n=1 Tax=Panicum virgatum TaxID=38727 RepID=A0A8T0SJJ7_PANVG|nr:hypothetical protein PVAP13_5KG401035 [Panicum virgatum]